MRKSEQIKALVAERDAALTRILELDDKLQVARARAVRAEEKLDAVRKALGIYWPATTTAYVGTSTVPYTLTTGGSVTSLNL